MSGSRHRARPFTVSVVLAGVAIATAGLPYPSMPPVAPAGQATASGPAAQAPAAVGTTIAYPSRASATMHIGLGIDVPCTAPSIAQLRAWAASPYRVIGVSISGANRICPEPYLNARWVAAVSALGWRILPLDQGLQAPCSPLVEDLRMSWNAATARGQGRTAAVAAAAAATAMGMSPGSALCTDMESYPSGGACQRAVLSYLAGWTQGLHARGFLSGVYSGNSSGTRHLSDSYFSAVNPRPDAVWNAWYTAGRSLTGWPGIPDSRWPEHQRIRQYSIRRAESHGGVTLVIDNDNVDAPTATVPQPRVVASSGKVSARRGPGQEYRVTATYPPGAQVSVVCQAADGGAGWDKLTTGAYLPDAYLHARASRCLYPYQVSATTGAELRAGPSSSRPRTGRLAARALAWVVCQQAGTLTGGSRIWDKIAYRRWISARQIAAPSATASSGPAPRC